jgi:spectrin beta
MITTPTDVEMGFLSQSALWEVYLQEMIQVLLDPRYGNSLTQVDATIMKHEAISNDILARVCDISL